MPDESRLDAKYFIDAYKYNCPFCNRRHVTYSTYERDSFQWTPEKTCIIYLVECQSCNLVSMHLSYEKIPQQAVYNDRMARFRFNISEDVELDPKFFYSVPTSFFALDSRIPRILRELFTEAEGCLKMNFLTGASACARKLVYELAKLERAKAASIDTATSERDTYEDQLKSLKTIRGDVEPEYFDTLLTIQQVTSSKVHEESYDGWEARHLRVILATIQEVLGVIPKVREEKRKAILGLKEELVDSKKTATAQRVEAGETPKRD
jgi:transcription elongation factor Elf1